MDKAAISFAILAAVLFIIVFLESIAWVKLWLKTGAAVKELKTAVARAERVETSLDEKWAKLTDGLAVVKTEGERAHQRIDAQAETMSAWNAKTMAREREEKKRLAQLNASQVQEELPLEPPTAGPAIPSPSPAGFRLFRKQG